MTPADLPPHWIDLDRHPMRTKDFMDYVESYAKLAVRQALERAAVCAWSTGMDEHTKTLGLPCDARTTGSRCAEAIRATIKEYE